MGGCVNEFGLALSNLVGRYCTYLSWEVSLSQFFPYLGSMYWEERNLQLPIERGILVLFHSSLNGTLSTMNSQRMLS